MARDQSWELRSELAGLPPNFYKWINHFLYGINSKPFFLKNRVLLTTKIFNGTVWWIVLNFRADRIIIQHMRRHISFIYIMKRLNVKYQCWHISNLVRMKKEEKVPIEYHSWLTDAHLYKLLRTKLFQSHRMSTAIMNSVH